MSAGLVTVNGSEMATTKDLDRTVLNIHITQESSLSCLLKALAATRQQKPAPKPAGTAPGKVQGRSSWEQKVLGAAQILLGVMCISLGVVISLNNSGQWQQWVIWTGAPFWMGSLVIVSGAFSVVGERRGGSWVHVATFFNLASVVAASVALGEGLLNIPSLNSRPDDFDYLCKPEKEHPWWVTSAPDPTPAQDWRMIQCKNTLANLTVMSASIHLLLLIYSIIALVIALICFGSGLRALWCSLRDCSQAYVALADPEAPPASEHPDA